MVFLYSVTTLYLALTIMIWERPYFTYTVSPSVHSREFSTLGDSVWFTLITMSTVGYGDVVASTPMGRFITIIMIFSGAYLTTLLIAVQASLLSLQETGKSAIVEVTEQKSALGAIVAALRFQVARTKRYKMVS
jgi:voltage-gated potassium channel